MTNLTRLSGSTQSLPTGALPPRLPFGDGNAASQWFPAMTEINRYTKLNGIGSVEFKGSGEHAKCFPPRVEATELQTITLVLKSGKRHEIGKVLPEGIHMREIKSTGELVEEIKALIIKFGQRKA